VPAKPAPKSVVIDAALMERAIKLRQDGLSMEAIGAKLGVKATAYLAKKIKATYGPDALAKPAGQPVPQPEPAKAAKPAAKRRRVVKAAKA
jgi:hypothetical protein